MKRTLITPFLAAALTATGLAQSQAPARGQAGQPDPVLIRRGSPEELSAQKAVFLNRHGYSDNTAETLAAIHLSPAALAEAAGPDFQPLVVFKPDIPAGNAVAANVKGTRLGVIFAQSAHSNSMDDIINYNIPAMSRLALKPLPGGDEGFGQIALLHEASHIEKQDRGPTSEFDAEARGIKLYRKYGGSEDVAKARIYWRLLDSMINAKTEGGADRIVNGIDGSLYNGIGIALHREMIDGKPMALDEASALNARASAAVREYAAANPDRYGARDGSDLFKARKVVHDMRNDPKLSLAGDVREALAMYDEAYQSLSYEHSGAIVKVAIPGFGRAPGQ